MATIINNQTGQPVGGGTLVNVHNDSSLTFDANHPGVRHFLVRLPRRLRRVVLERCQPGRSRVPGAVGPAGVLVQAVLGTASPNGTLTHRSLPWQHSKWLPWLYAVEAKLLNGVGVPGQDEDSGSRLPYFWDVSGGTAGKAKIAVLYRSLDYDVYPDADDWNNEFYRFVTKSFTYAAENLVMPRGMFKWVPDKHTIPRPRPSIHQADYLPMARGPGVAPDEHG